MAREKVGVTKRAAIQRINRKLAVLNGHMLKTTRGNRWCSTLGDYYVVDPKKNWIIKKDVDPEDLGRELGVLEGYEQVVD